MGPDVNTLKYSASAFDWCHFAGIRTCKSYIENLLYGDLNATYFEVFYFKQISWYSNEVKAQISDF